MKKTLLLMAAAVFLLGPTARAVEAAGQGDARAIRSLLMGKFDRPDARLTVEPVVVRGGHAVAGWVQGERGGRALLRSEHGQWKLVACAGAAFREAAELEKAGIAPADARALAKAVAAAEAKLPADQARKLSLFGGVVQMDADGERLPLAHEGGKQ